MPIVSGFVVPKMNSTSHVGNIRLLRPVVMAIELQEDGQAEIDNQSDTSPRKISIEILAIFEKFRQICGNKITSGSLNEVLTTCYLKVDL